MRRLASTRNASPPGHKGSQLKALVELFESYNLRRPELEPNPEPAALPARQSQRCSSSTASSASCARRASPEITRQFNGTCQRPTGRSRQSRSKEAHGGGAASRPSLRRSSTSTTSRWSRPLSNWSRPVAPMLMLMLLMLPCNLRLGSPAPTPATLLQT
jgi:hypothetical protein